MVPLSAPAWIYWHRRGHTAPEGRWNSPTRQHQVSLSQSQDQPSLLYGEIGGSRPLGELPLVGAQVQALPGGGAVSALQLEVAAGHVVHIEAENDADRDRWVFELNLGALRAAASAINDVTARSPRGSASAINDVTARSPRGSAASRQAASAAGTSSREVSPVSHPRPGRMWVEAADAPRERRSPLRAAPAALLDPTLDPTNPGSRLHPSNPESAAAAAARLGLPSSWRFGQPPSGSAAASTRHVSGRSDLAGLNLEPTAAEIVESIMERAVSGRETHLEQGNGRQLPWGPASPESSPPPPSYSPPPPLPRSPPPRSPPPRSPSHPTSKTESSSASESWGAVASFVDGAAVFAVSRMWSDLVGAFLFELHPLPFCGDSFLRRPCAPDAPSRAQFLYAVALVPLAGLGKHLAESRFAHVPGIGLLPTMIGYVVGWAFANAFQQGLVEIARDNPGLCDGASGCLGLNTAYSVLVTMVAALLMLVLHPYTQSVECGDSALVDWLEDWVEDIWQLVVRGLSATCMVLWYYTCYELAHVGVAQATPFAQANLLVCFTLVTFFVGSLLSLKLERWESMLRSLQSAAPRPWRGSLLRFSDLLQNLFGYIAGCLFNDVMLAVFPTLSAGPTLPVVLSNAGLTAAWTIAASLYIRSAGAGGMSGESREAVEQYFLVNSASFFVGWMWLVAARDLVTVLTQLACVLAQPLLGESAATDELAELVAVLLACPAFTVAIWWAQQQFKARTQQPESSGVTARVQREKREMQQDRALARSEFTSNAVDGGPRARSVEPGGRAFPQQRAAMPMV